MTSFICNALERQIIERDNRLVSARGWVWEQGVTANSHKGCFLSDVNILKLLCGDGCTTQ